jgi:hypothetical protein
MSTARSIAKEAMSAAKAEELCGGDTNALAVAAALRVITEKVIGCMRMPDPSECEFAEDYDNLASTFNAENKCKQKFLDVVSALEAMGRMSPTP